MPWFPLTCCFGRKRPKERRRTRRSKHASNHLLKHEAIASHGHAHGNGSTLSPTWSIADGEDYHSCREEFSTTDGCQMSPIPSAPASPKGSFTMDVSSKVIDACSAPLKASQTPDEGHNATSSNSQTLHQQFHDLDIVGTSESSEEQMALDNPVKRGLVGCLTILDNLTGKPTEELQKNSKRRRSHQRFTGRPDAGASLTEGGDPGRHQRQRQQQQHDAWQSPEDGISCSYTGSVSAIIDLRDMSMSTLELDHCYEDASQSVFNLRSLDYMRTKVKVPISSAIYHLVAADVYTFPQKQHHIAKLVNLPTVPTPKHCLSPDTYLPPMLIINIQLPTYAASLFGQQDGPGHSMVFYYALPEDFDASKFENQKAMGLIKRFVQNGREADGTHTRERLKIIPKIVNVDEWAAKGPLSPAEYKLLVNYNEKPILTRPQQVFTHGPNYLEIDLDLHCYAYLARKALTSFLSRLQSTVWETALIIQGNSPDELPEQVLAAARLYRVDLAKERPFGSFGPHQGPPASAPGTRRTTEQSMTSAEDSKSGVSPDKPSEHYSHVAALGTPSVHERPSPH